MRIFIAGRSRFAAAVLADTIDAGHTVAGICANGTDEFTAAWRTAGLPGRFVPAGMLTATTLPDGVDLIVAAHAHDFIGRATRLRSRLGAIGYHPSLLPLHRGRDAVRWVIHNRERVTGGTVYWLDDGVDTGPIAARSHVLIHPDDTARSLWRRDLLPLGLRLLRDVVRDVAAGDLYRVAQDEALATWEPSWEREPLHRPDLLMIGSNLHESETVRVSFEGNGHAPQQPAPHAPAPEAAVWDWER